MITVGAIDQAQTSATERRHRPAVVGLRPHGGRLREARASSAPGRYLVMPVPVDVHDRHALPDRVVAPGYMWMSGTSFAAPVVSGAAAQILARHPTGRPTRSRAR